MNISKRKIFQVLKVSVLIYAIIGIALYYLQEKFLFHPEKLESNHKFTFHQPIIEMRLAFNETDTMSLVKFLPADSFRKGVVLYYHGNMRNIEHYAAYAEPFTKLGYEVWMQDYPGFGKSTGTITEIKLYDQAKQVKKMADAAYNSDSIIIYGKSLGTGIAAYVAADSKAAMLILETPYYSIPDLFGYYAFIYPISRMSTFKIPTYSFLEHVTIPVIIFHGTNDRVIPYSSAKKLERVLKTDDKFITAEDADHQNINRSGIYYKTIDSLLR